MIDAALTSAIRLFTGARAQWRDCPPESPAPRVYFANHTSHLDFAVLWAVLPPTMRRRTRPAAAHDYWSETALRRWLARDVFRAALIERAHVTRTNNPVEQLAACLESGDSIILFPEGTRSHGPDVGAFKSGLFHLAKRRPEAQLVPAYLENLNRVLPKGELLALPLICHVTFGPPLQLEPEETKDDFLSRARRAVEQLRRDSNSDM